jgi:hypothetical protein
MTLAVVSTVLGWTAGLIATAFVLIPWVIS